MQSCCCRLMVTGNSDEGKGGVHWQGCEGTKKICLENIVDRVSSVCNHAAAIISHKPAWKSIICGGGSHGIVNISNVNRNCCFGRWCTGGIWLQPRKKRW